MPKKALIWPLFGDAPMDFFAASPMDEKRLGGDPTDAEKGWKGSLQLEKRDRLSFQGFIGDGVGPLIFARGNSA